MDFKEYLKHISIVILGILIAFWINNIGMYYKEKANQKQVLITVLNELQDNALKIQSTIANLDSLQSTFTRIKEKDVSGGYITINYFGINIRSIGYETAKYTGVLKDINYKLASKIVEYYEYQNTINQLDQMMSDEVYTNMKNGIHEEKSIDYMLTIISNLKINLKEFDTEQKQLIGDVKLYLDRWD